ncbi:MAG: fluoride efflux transporter CrcB [Solirubrobacteraceae bacterium]|nr:fluoride efflux transporter CrcB [Solirubrobacteraceae bacterium]
MPARTHDPRVLGAVAVGGAVGTLARAGLLEALPADATGWPWPTFVANIVGAFLLGWFAVRLPPPERSPYARPLLGAGFCGALTTFSTLQLEVVDLAREGVPELAVAYMAVSAVLGVVVVAAATRIARRTGAAPA